MKALFAMFFSLVLIASQAMSLNEVRDFGVQKAVLPRCCGHCGSCQQRSCCGHNRDSGSRQSAPATPSRGLSSNDWQLCATLSVNFSSPATEAAAFPSNFSAHLSFAAPLYDRNCSYLI
jgi:hypothetical protein